MKNSPEIPLMNEEAELSERELVKLKDPTYLPTREEVIRAFASGGVLENKWVEFYSDPTQPVFEVLTKEFVEALGNYVSMRVKSIYNNKNLPITILEVGAGNGRLTHFLKQFLDDSVQDKVKIIATDSKELGVKDLFPVEKVDYRDALHKYNPSIVISCWMPLSVDFTEDFRAIKNVEEYILIGEVDAGCSGDSWKTWGYPESFDEEGNVIKTHYGETAPYIVGGFEKNTLDSIAKYQICRTDEVGEESCSSTVSFKRLSI